MTPYSQPNGQTMAGLILWFKVSCSTSQRSDCFPLLFFFCFSPPNALFFFMAIKLPWRTRLKPTYDELRKIWSILYHILDTLLKLFQKLVITTPFTTSFSANLRSSAKHIEYGTVQRKQYAKVQQFKKKTINNWGGEVNECSREANLSYKNVKIWQSNTSQN